MGLDTDQPQAPPTGPGLSIAAVERETGLSKDTLRVWERRYGFPTPGRDAADERVYPPEQVERLQLIARLLGAGYRPGRIVGLPPTQLELLSRTLAAPGPTADPGRRADLDPLIDLVRRHEVLELRREFTQSILRLGLGRFLTEVVAPLTVSIGEAWMRGDLQVFEEHIYTESVTAVLRSALGTTSSLPRPGMPRVLLTTLPPESHLLGLLMAETMFVLEGCECVSLGAQTPLAEIVHAAYAHRADIVGLSFSPAYNPQMLLRAVQELRLRLPRSVDLWLGGSNAALQRKLPEGIHVISQLQDFAAELEGWQVRPQGAG
jgi:methylmalonyl-CoA mutase cobalamin-binding subunit